MNEILTAHAQSSLDLILGNLKEIEAEEVENTIITPENFMVEFIFRDEKYRYEYKALNENKKNRHTMYAVYEDGKTEILQWGVTIVIIKNLLRGSVWMNYTSTRELYSKYHKVK